MMSMAARARLISAFDPPADSCGYLDARRIAPTVKSPMFSLLRSTLVLCILLGISCRLADAAVIFRPGEKSKYVAPGEEEISGNAGQLFHTAQEAETRGDRKRAIKAYRTLVRKYPKDALAPGSGFKAAQLEEQTQDYLGAAELYRVIMERYPSDLHFDEAIEGLFRIGEMYLNGKKIKVLGISIANAHDRAVEIFAAIIRNAPYGKYTAHAQFDIGLAREKDGANDAAIQAYQAVVDKFPNDPVAIDAQYQIGYIWFTSARAGTKDYAATERARTAFEDFLFRFPNSEKAAQARANLNLLQRKQTSTAFTIAKYYDKQKAYRAAVIYYNEVIRQQPGSNESMQAQKRIDQLRAKVGDAVIKPLQTADAATTRKKSNQSGGTARSGGSGMRGSANEAAPLPPVEADPSLPPPASLVPDNTTAPGSSTLSGGTLDPASSGTGSSSANDTSAEATPSPAAPAP
jgi:outer membrane protein assembly factor BamD